MLVIIGISFLLLLVLGHELGHFISAKAFKLKIEEFGFGFPPKILSRQHGETKYSLNLLPFGGFVRIYGENQEELEGKTLTEADKKRSFFYQPAWKRAIIVVAGAVMNFIIGWIAISVVLMLGMPQGLVVEHITADSPAEAVGFQIGEPLTDYNSAEEFINFVNAHKGEEIIINEKAVTPRIDPPEGQGSLGVTVVETGAESVGPVKAVWEGFIIATGTTIEITKAFGRLFASLLTGDFSPAKEVSGPVGVYGILGQRSLLGAAALIQLLGIISLNLVVLNLIPFPALDGGRLLFIGIEKVIRRPLNSKIELWINGFGVSLLLIFMVLVTIRDIANL